MAARDRSAAVNDDVAAKARSPPTPHGEQYPPLSQAEYPPVLEAVAQSVDALIDDEVLKNGHTAVIDLQRISAIANSGLESHQCTIGCFAE